ncbi:transposable element Tc1 transposase [Trichonephila clavipes]|nr:transposable element Tc1 transposase [Trichonephila clavipes]
MSGDAQGSVPILLSKLHAIRALNQELWSWVPFFWQPDPLVVIRACQTLLWSARSLDLSPIEHVWDMMRRQLHLPENNDDLSRQLEKIWQEIPQDTNMVLYHSMPRRVAACLQARVGLTLY